MIQPPKEMDMEDFEYFVVVKDMMVAGIYADDKDNIYGVYLKGNAKRGSILSCPKDNLIQQVEAGEAYIISDHKKAMAEDLSGTNPKDSKRFLE